MFAKIAKLTALVSVAAVVLTACTPPMPPEVKAALLEQTYTCIHGSASVNIPESMDDAAPSIADSAAGNCPGMTFTVNDGSKPNIVFGSSAPAASQCSATTSVPYAIDAAVVVASLADAGGVIFSPQTAAAVLDGTITKWNDPRITKDNGGMELSSGPISIVPTTDALAVSAFANWYKHLTGKTFNASKLSPKRNLVSTDLGELPEGSVALLPYSTYSVYSVNAMTIPLAASIIVDGKVNPSGVIPDVSGIGSAATQLDYQKSGNTVSVKLNYALKPVPPLGSDTAPDPYGAIYPVNLDLCCAKTAWVRSLRLYRFQRP